MFFNNVSVWLVSGAACCTKKGQRKGGVRCLRVRWCMMRTMVAPQEKRNAVHFNQGSAIRGSFESAYVQFLIMCRFQSSSLVFHACTQISHYCRETSGHAW